MFGSVLAAALAGRAGWEGGSEQQLMSWEDTTRWAASLSPDLSLFSSNKPLGCDGTCCLSEKLAFAEVENIRLVFNEGRYASYVAPLMNTDARHLQ